MVGGKRHILLKTFDQIDPPVQKRRRPINIRSYRQILKNKTKKS